MAKERQYIDFYVQLRDLNEEANQFKVAVLPSPAVGETREAFVVNYNSQELESYLSRLERRSIDQESLIQLGERLTDLLLPAGEVRSLFEKAIADAGQDGGVRLRLLTSEAKLARLPWEYSYFSLYKGAKDQRHFLVLNPQISLVRHEPIGKKHPEVEGVDPKTLHLLVAMANPLGDLDLEREKNNLTKVLAGLKVDEVEFEWEPLLDNVTTDDLTNALLRKPEIFYFAGHGQFDREGYIYLQRAESGALDSISAIQLAQKLKQAGVRVAVFGACESAQRDGAAEWAGIAPTLVAEGVPVVVAMQYKVLDSHAIAFSKMFYTALAAGLSVDEAVVSGRLAMLGEDNSKERHIGIQPGASPQKPAANVQWGIPVLYMRSSHSLIFPRETSSPVADQLRTVIEQNIGVIQNARNFVGINVEEITRSVYFKQEFGEVNNVDNFKGIEIGKL